MLFSIIRIVLFLIYIIFILKNNIIKPISKKRILIISVLFLVTIFLVPVENLFVDFKTPESVFNYKHIGRIEKIIHGNESCMVYYSKGKASYSYIFIEKNGENYKIANTFNNKKISKKIDENGVFEIYNVTGTNDYYVLGTINPHAMKIEIYNEADKRIETSIERIEQTSFVCFFLDDLSKKDYLFVDGEKIYFINE